MCLEQEQQEHRLRSKNTIFFEEHVFFAVNHPTLPRKLKNQNFFFLFSYISLATKPIESLRFTKHNNMPTDLQNTKTFNNYSVDSFTFSLQTQRLSKIQITKTFNKHKELTHLQPNLQTQQSKPK